MLVLSDFTFSKSANKINYIPLFAPFPPPPAVPQICQITFCKCKVFLLVSPQTSHDLCHSSLWSWTLACSWSLSRVLSYAASFLKHFNLHWCLIASLPGSQMKFQGFQRNYTSTSFFQLALGWKRWKEILFIPTIRLESRSYFLNIKWIDFSFGIYKRHYSVVDFDLWVWPFPWDFFPVWVFWCTIRLDFWVKAFPHSVHL